MLDTFRLQPVPKWLEKKLLESKAKEREPRLKTKKYIEGRFGVAAGGRNDLLFKYGSSLAARGRTDSQIEVQLFAVGRSAKPPLEDSEIEAVFDSVCKLKKGEKGPILGSEYVLFLSAMGYEFALRETDNRVMVNGKPLDDIIMASIRVILRDYDYTATGNAKDAFIDHAKRNSFHPIKTYLESIEWDGEDHISKLASYFKDKGGFFQTWLRRWLIGSVERVYNEGQQNRVLVMDGPQNLGKSYFIRWLASNLKPYYYEGPVHPNSKDCRLLRLDKFIWEVPELGSTFRKSDMDAIKDFLSQETQKDRKPFDQFPTEKPCISSYIATVNNSYGFFNDPTGSRRYMTSSIEEIDWSYANDIDVDQIWAQAKALFDSGETGILTGEESKQSDKNNEIFEVTDYIEDIIEEVLTFEKDSFAPNTSIFDALKARGVPGSPKSVGMRVSSYLTKQERKGKPLRKDRKYIDGHQIRGWFGVRMSSFPRGVG